MERLETYTVTKDFNPDYNIQVIGVLSGSITIYLLTQEGGAQIGLVGTLNAGECKAIIAGRATIRIEVSAGTEYTVA